MTNPPNPLEEEPVGYDRDEPLVLAIDDNDGFITWTDFTGESTIASFCDALNQHYGYNRGRDHKWKIDADGTFLESSNGEKFKDYGITCDYRILVVTIDTVGGTQISVRREIPNNDKLNVVQGKCCMKLDNRKCVKMKCCGCLISADGMYMHLNYTKTKAHYKSLNCPIYECRKPWIVRTCLYIASVKGQEKKEWINLFQKRAMKKDRNKKKCPHCGVYGSQDRTKKWMRISCGGCQKEFCFSCGLNWKKSSSTRICGNKNCIAQIKQKRLNLKVYLSNEGRGWVARNDVPNARVCPKCTQLITHSQACKHMICQRCGYEFCWLCCGDYNNHNTCVFLPVQDIYSLN